MWSDTQRRSKTFTKVHPTTEGEAGSNSGTAWATAQPLRPLHSGGVAFCRDAGSAGTARQSGASVDGCCKQDVAKAGWKPARAETARLAPFTTAPVPVREVAYQPETKQRQAQIEI